MDFKSLYRTASPAVVRIATEDGSGSGVFVDPRGLIATCRHVVARRRVATVNLANGSELIGKIVRAFRVPDLAFVLVAPAAYPALEFAPDDELEVGEEAAVIG